MNLARSPHITRKLFKFPLFPQFNTSRPISTSINLLINPRSPRIPSATPRPQLPLVLDSRLGMAYTRLEAQFADMHVIMTQVAVLI